MAITSVRRDWNGEVDIVRMVTTNTLAQAAAADYLTAQIDNLATVNSGTWEWKANDMVLCSASDGLQLFTLSADLSTLEIYSTAGDGAVTLPVVSGNFTTFDGTLGALGDLGYAPSDASKTKVVMAGSAVVVNHIAKFVDTVGTVDDTAGTAINSGSIQAGLSGTAGTLISFPGTASKGSLILAAVANTGDTAVTISNALHGQASVYSIPDGGQTTSNFLISNSSGTQTIATGNLAMTVGYMQQSPANALTAHAGGGQGSALALTKQINRVTTVGSAGDSVLLPASIAGRVVTVINAAAANAMDIFPQSGDVINALTANTALSVAANKTITFYCAIAGTWNSLLTA